MRIATLVLTSFAVCLTGAALLFLGFAGLMIYAIFVPDETGEDASTTALLVFASISAFVGSAFAWVAAAIWRVVIDPRRHSHA